jgi:hypothetical protein
MNKALKLLQEVQIKFAQNLSDERSLAIKQTIFKHVGAFDVL